MDEVPADHASEEEIVEHNEPQIVEVNMATPLGLPPPEPLQILQGNTSLKWKKFKQKWSNYEIATGVAVKTSPTRVATLLTVIGDEAVDVYNTFAWEQEGDALKIERVLEKFEAFCNPRKNTIYERYVFFSRNQETGESIDHYVTVLKNLADTCEFGALKESLIRDRIVFGIQDSTVRERLLRDAELTLKTATEKVRAAELTQVQLKQIKADKTIDESIHAVKAEASISEKDGKTRGKVPVIDCKYCGRKHPRDKNQCPAYGAKCQKCGLANHFAVKCRKKSSQTRRLHLVEVDEDDADEEFIIDMVTHKTESSRSAPSQLFATMIVNDKAKVKFQLDCGATCNILPLKDYVRAMGDPDDLYLQRSKAKLAMYNGTVMHPVGKCKLKCTRDGSSHTLEFQVVKGEVRPLLSAESCQKLKFLKVLVKDPPHHVDTVTQVPPVTQVLPGATSDSIMQEYAEVFEGLGCLSEPYHIEVDPAVKPVIHPPRKVPVTLREPLKKELTRMVAEEILTPVTEPSDWVSSMVTVVKPNKLRICIDPKDLNGAIKRSHYPLPTIEEVATKLSKAKVFSVLDAKSGFWQIKLDDASSRLTTFNTPFGRYRWLRMPFGISSAPEEFQKRMNNTFGDLNGAAVIADDLLVYGEGDNMEMAIEDHDKNLRSVLERAKERNITFNKEKVRLRLTEVPYIGHLLTGGGLKPDPKKVEAILMMPKPTDVQSVKRLLGMANYLSKFLPRLSTVTEPLRRLEDKEVEWHWNDVHDEAIREMKTLIANHPVLRYYDVTKEVTLQCDASQSGLGGALLQEGQPVAFTSRALTATERNYAQIEKELLAIVHACERFDQYLFGRDVTVETDHKPLETILQKPLLAAPKRLQRMMMRLQNYNLKVVYKRGRELYIADTLSRAYVPSDHTTEKEVEFIRAIEEIDMTQHLSVTKERLRDIQQKTKDDAALQLLKQTIQHGWPDRRDALPVEIRAFYNYRDELSVHGDILFRGSRVIVPTVMRSEMVQKIHASHIGIEGCLRRAREILHWPGMSAAVKDYVSACGICNSFRMEQPKQPLIPQEVPDRPWSKVGVDLFTLNKEDYVILVDDYSNFFEFHLLSNTKVTTVVTCLKSQFARHGIPNEVRSDNGPQFTAAEFRQFAKEWDFEHTTSSPYYAQSNGKVEKAVSTAKRILKKAKADHKDPYLALLDWRNTPTEGLESSPVQRLMGRRTRTLLPTAASLLKPQLVKSATKPLTCNRWKQAKYYDKGSKDLKELKRGDVVRVRPDPTDVSKQWKKAVCLKEVAPRSYEVVIKGRRFRRNRRHLIASQEDPEEDCSIKEPVELPSPEHHAEEPCSSIPNQSDVPPDEDQTQGPQTADQSPQPPERRSTRGRILRTPVRFKDYYKY